MVLKTILSEKNWLENGDVINDNDISTYDQAYDSNEELTDKLSKVINI